MIKANYFRSSIRRHGTSNRKFSHSNRFILQKKSPACTTDAGLRKYGILGRDVQVLDHILTMEIKTHFILNLPRPKITTANACATRPPNCRVYIMYVIIRNVFKTIYDVYISYFKLSFYITIIFRINVTLPPVNPNGFRRLGCAGVRRSNFRSGQVQYKMGFDFHC